MREQNLDIPWPSKGLIVNCPVSAQPEGSATALQNVRSYDPRGGRDRGGSRAGMSKYAGGNQINGANAIQDINKCVVTANSTNLSTRAIRPMAIAGGTLKRFTSSSVSAVTNGAGAFSATPPMIFSTQLLQNLYFADGVNWKLYQGSSDSVIALVASSGSLPTDSGGNAPRLLAGWRNRLVYSGLPLDDKNWFMSAVFDPTNWNYNPSPSVETQAVAGNNSTCAEAMDTIQALIPYNDEILIFLCDHSTWQMTGDPMAGGRLDLVADGVGGAFGMPFCRDSQGIIYFVSNRGAIYSFTPGGMPQRISDPIAELVLTTNMSNTACRMAWDERQFGFHVWFTQTGGAASATHYFYDTRNQSWWQDVYGNNNHNPLAVLALDGDLSGDRVILLGGQDGFLRKLDTAASTDDGTTINSSVTLGPIQDKDRNGITLGDIQMDLDTASGSISYAVLAAQDPETALANAARASGIFTAGRNRSQSVRVFGHALYVKLTGTTSWQAEYLKVRARIPEGRARQRIF